MTLLDYILIGVAGSLAILCLAQTWLLYKARRSKYDLGTLALVPQKIESAIFITDLDGNIEWVNEAFGRITGYSLPEVAGKNPGPVLLGPSHNARTVQRLR